MPALKATRHPSHVSSQAVPPETNLRSPIGKPVARKLLFSGSYRCKAKVVGARGGDSSSMASATVGVAGSGLAAGC